jgi:hypothetical protein
MESRKCPSSVVAALCLSQRTVLNVRLTRLGCTPHKPTKFHKTGRIEI